MAVTLLTQARGRRGRIAGRAFVLLAALLGCGALAAPGAARAEANPADMLTYMPTELVHSILGPAQVEQVMGELGEYDIGQALFQMPRFKKNGKIKLPESNREMLGVWSETAASYDAAHGTAVSVTAVFNAVPKATGLNLELPATRTRMIAAVEAAVNTGIDGVQLDIEPYPTGPGYIALLEELDGALARVHFAGRLSVVAPGDNWTWSPEYLQRVAGLVDQLDPTFYDTEYATVAAYQELIEEGLAYYTANAPASAALIPVIPCYSPDPWHDPAIENVPNATEALGAALAEGSRVEGAGLWWWYSFYEGHYKHGDAAAERAAWRARTVNLPYSP
jgi:hypothetical protein